MFRKKTKDWQIEIQYNKVGKNNPLVFYEEFTDYVDDADRNINWIKENIEEILNSNPMIFKDYTGKELIRFYLNTKEGESIRSVTIIDLI